MRHGEDSHHACDCDCDQRTCNLCTICARVGFSATGRAPPPPRDSTSPLWEGECSLVTHHPSDGHPTPPTKSRSILPKLG